MLIIEIVKDADNTQLPALRVITHPLYLFPVG